MSTPTLARSGSPIGHLGRSGSDLDEADSVPLCCQTAQPAREAGRWGSRCTANPYVAVCGLCRLCARGGASLESDDLGTPPADQRCSRLR